MNPLDTLKTGAEGLVEKFTGENPKLLQETFKLIENMPDGFSGFLKQFQDRGLGKFVSSWMDKGSKDTISPEQIVQGFGADKINELAKASGLDPKIVPQKLTTLLPKVFEHFPIPANFAGTK